MRQNSNVGCYLIAGFQRRTRRIPRHRLWRRRQGQPRDRDRTWQERRRRGKGGAPDAKGASGNVMMLDAPHKAVLHLDRCTSWSSCGNMHAASQSCFLNHHGCPFGNDTYVHPAYPLPANLGPCAHPRPASSTWCGAAWRTHAPRRASPPS